MTSELGWFKMAGVGGMLENTSSQDSEDTSDRRFSPRSQACRKFTTFSDGFIHEKIVPCVDKSPKSLKVVRMNGAAGLSPKTVQPLMSNKPVLRSRSDKPCQESQLKKKRSNSQTLVEEGPCEIEVKHDAMVEGQPQHPATPPTSPKSPPQTGNYSGIKCTIASPVKNSLPATDHCLTKGGDASEPPSPPVLPKPLAVNGVTKPTPINGVCLPPDIKDTFNKCLIIQPKKNGLQLFTNLNAKDGCFGPPPISPDISRSCTPPASTSSGNSCRDDASSKDSTRSTETTCQWFQCGVSVEETDLMDHIRLKHVEPQLKKAAELSEAAPHDRNSGKDQGKFVCLWTDCKVYNKKSCSRTWLERHVVSHAGDKPFKCIVAGCGQRFTTEGALQRHVNGHFNTTIQNSDNCKTVKHKDDTPSKQTKKKKLRRKRSWLIKTDDYFDSRTMEHIQQSLLKLSRWTHIDVSGDPNSVTLHSTVVARRTETSGIVQLLLRWKPESILPDQWVMESQLSSYQTRSVPMHALPHDSSVCVDTQFYRQHRYRKHRRK